MLCNLPVSKIRDSKELNFFGVSYLRYIFQAKIVFFDEDGDKVEDDEEDDNDSSSGESGEDSRGQDSVDNTLDQSQAGISQLYVSSKPAAGLKGLHEGPNKTGNFLIKAFCFIF